MLFRSDAAASKGLAIVAGTQRRHEAPYVEAMKRIHDGAIGELVGGQCYWYGGGIWFRGDNENWTQMQNQCNNWYHYIWACGDQICEQHIHNLDVGCWAKNMYPVECNGMGGWGRRAYRARGDGESGAPP